jgi:hypothetical protein
MSTSTFNFSRIRLLKWLRHTLLPTRLRSMTKTRIVPSNKMIVRISQTSFAQTEVTLIISIAILLERGLARELTQSSELVFTSY